MVIQNGRLVYANARFLKAVGRTLDEAAGMDPSLTLTDPLMRERARERVRRAEAGESQSALVYQAKRADGATVWARLESTPCSFRGRPACLSIAQDVTEEVTATIALRESEERYRRLFEELPLVIATKRETEDRYRALVDGLPDGVTVHIGRTIMFANDSIARILGLAGSADLIGRDVFEFLPPAERPRAHRALAELDQPQTSPSREYMLRRADGRGILVEVFGRRVTFGDRPAIQSVIRDITDRRRAERSQAAIYRIADASARASSLADFLASLHSAVGELMDARNFFIALKDGSGENFSFPYYRDELCPAMSSVPIKATLCGHVLEAGRPMLISREEMDVMRARGVAAMGPSSVSWIGVPLTHRDASFGVLVVQSYREDVRYSEADRDLLSFVSHHIAEAIDRQRKEDQIEHLAFHDGLTGLPNRLLFEDRLTNGLALAERRQAPLSVLFVDLDRFKVINDSLGHPIGDDVLRLVGRRLAEGLRDGDSLARRGGDEFLVLLPDTPPAGAAKVAQKLIDCIRAPMTCGGHELTLSASCGISVFPENGSDTDSLLKAADIAMYRAKESGRDAYRLFNPDMNTAAQRRLTVETRLRRSIAHREIGPHFQPIIDAATGRVVAAEALLRWSPFLSATMPPKEFIPVAEQSGLIVSLGDFVLREALRHARDWPESQGHRMRVAVNFAARQVQDPACVELILQALHDTSFPANRLQLEVSESAQITEDTAAVERLRALKHEGVSIAIDDFGVGYSSLSRLRHLPFDTLKIDGTFIRDLTTDSGSGAVAGAVIALGMNLGLEVIAEGVETEAQKKHLLARSCPLMQGFLFAGAMPPGVFGAWVRERES